MAIKTVTAQVNGQTYTLTWEASSGTYKASVTAPTETSGSKNGGQGPGVGTNARGKGYYPVVIVAKDDAGNVTTVDAGTPTLGDKCKLKVLEKVAPVVRITSPTSGAFVTDSSAPIKYSATDSESGINPASARIQIDSNPEQVAVITGSGTTFSGSFTPAKALSDGSHTVKFYCYDYDGNKSNVATTTFVVDTVAPSLDILSPADKFITNNVNIVVSGTTTDVTSGGVVVKIKLNGADQGTIPLDNGNFNKTVICREGVNTIVITATDRAGKSQSVTRTVTINTVPPEISKIELIPNPTEAGSGYIIRVTVTDA